MFADIDVNEQLNVIAVLQFLQDGTKKITTYDLKTKRLIGEIGNEYLPLGPRLSPNKNQLAFFSNSKPLYLWDMENDNIKSIFDHSVLNTGFCEWSSCGTQICFSAYSTDTKKNTPPDIYLMNLESQEVVQLTDSAGVDRFPQWSPSNQFIAFHRQYLNEPNTPKKIYIVDTRTKQCSTIPYSYGTNQIIGRFCWSKDSSHLLIKEVGNDGTYLKIFRISNMELEWTFSYPEMCGGVFFSDTDNVLVVCKHEIVIVTFPDGKIIRRLRIPDKISIQDTLRGPSVSLCPASNDIYFLNEKSCIYRMNSEGTFEFLFRDIEEQLPVFNHQEYTIKSKDNRDIPVHSFIPENTKEIGVLFVHGGPGNSVDDPKDPLVLQFIKEGYEVIVPAYRGCSGYGKEHKEANRGEYGRADVWDVLATGADWKIKTKNKRPLAIIGNSYGGYLTFLSLSYPDIPWDCGITLWGVTRIENLALHLPKAYPIDPIERRKAKKKRNPIEQANKIRTPLLIFHAGNDVTSTNEEVNLIQQQIQSHGGVCELFIYDNDTHGLGKHRQEMFDLIFPFLEKQTE